MRSPDGTSLPFPRLRARDLNGRDLFIPDELDGDPSVVIVAFHRWHQRLVDTWLAWLEPLGRTHPGLRVYEVPTLASWWAPVRRFIDGGMAAAIRAREIRERTLTVYSNVRRVTRALGLEDTRTIAVIVVDRDGRLRWVGLGGFERGTATELERALANPSG